MKHYASCALYSFNAVIWLYLACQQKGIVLPAMNIIAASCFLMIAIRDGARSVAEREGDRNKKDEPKELEREVP